MELAFPALTSTPERLAKFYNSLESILESWIQRSPSAHTQRAYRADILTFVRFLGLVWPVESHQLLSVTVSEVQRYRNWLVESGAAPKTLNRRISSLSGFYRYLSACAAELRLPVNLPNPAHSQFIARSTADPVAETKSLSAAAARELLSLPCGEKPEDYRDRAIMALYLYTGMRLSTGCRLMLEDFHWDHSSTATLRLREKGGRVRIIGVHAAAADAVTRYIAAAGLSSGPLFRPLSSPKPGSALADRAMAPISMYTLLLRYLERLPGSTRPGSGGRGQNVYTPHSLRATTATLLLDSGVDITKVQDLLGHRHITTTQIYDKRRRGPRQSASHEMPL